MELEEIYAGQRLRATEDVMNNIGGEFPAGTVFIVYENDLFTDLRGPCLYEEGATDEDACWFYWDGQAETGIPACAGKFEAYWEDK